MSTFTRRGFITRTSLGLAAVGALGAIGAVPALAQTTGPTGSMPMGPMPTRPNPGAQMLIPAGAPFMLYISDPTTGAGSILVGEQSIPFTNGAVVHALRQAIG